MGKLMPKGRDFHGLYLGEPYWSHTYNYLDDPSSGSVYWTTAEGATKGAQSQRRLGHGLPGRIASVREDQYLSKGGILGYLHLP